MAIRCRSHGYEVLQSRVVASEDIKKRIGDETLKLIGWNTYATFEQTNFKVKERFTVDGKDATHIFSFNKVFAQEDMKPFCERLNRTDFKVLVLNNPPKMLEALGLKDVVMVHSFECHMGGSRFKTYIYLKTKSPQITTSDRILRSASKNGALESPVKNMSPIK